MFFDCHIQLNPEYVNTERESYDFFNLIGDIGGILEMLTVIWGCFVYPFTDMRIMALVTNRLYHVSSKTSELAKDLTQLNADKKCKNKHSMRNTGEINLHVPGYLSWEFLRYKFYKFLCCGCCDHKNRKFHLYLECTKMGFDNFVKDIDLVN